MKRIDELKRGKSVWVPNNVLKEIERVRKSNGLIFRSEAFRIWNNYAKKGQHIDRRNKQKGLGGFI